MSAHMLPREVVMVRLIPVFLCSLVCTLPGYAQSVLVCSFEQSALVQQDSGGELSAKIGKGSPLQIAPDELDSETIVISGLDTKRPVLKANLGESTLTILRTVEHRDFGKVLWLAEAPPLGGLNIYTVFLKSKIVIESKQQWFITEGPLGSISMGRCK